MAEKKKRKSRIIIFGILILILLAVLAFVLAKTGLLPIPGIGEKEGVRTTQTTESRKSEKKLMELIAVEDLEIREEAYGILKLSGTCSFPDFSVYFEKNNEEAAGAENAAEYEKQLFALTEKDLKDGKKTQAAGKENTGNGQVPYVTRELTVNLSVIDVSRGKDGWKEKELEELLKQAAFDSELEEFAFELVGDYLSLTTDWEAEKTVWEEDGTDNEEVQAQ